LLREWIELLGGFQAILSFLNTRCHAKNEPKPLVRGRISMSSTFNSAEFGLTRRNGGAVAYGGRRGLENSLERRKRERL
jgi:hypothetical protein